MRAIGYYRLPTASLDSPTEMEGALAEYCQTNLHQPVATYVEAESDDGDPTAEYQRMLDFMKSSRREFLIVVPDGRHLGTELESVVGSLVELEGTGARVACLDDEFPDPLQNAFQSLGVKGVSRTRSRRIKESMRRRASRGEALGKPLFGYAIGPEGRLVVDRSEAPVVELIFRLYTKDELGLRLIAQHLNERGLTTRRGGRWNTASIREILRNPAYMGTYTRLDMRVPKAHEAIVPAETINAARDIAKTRRPVGRVSNAEPFVLSGVAFCAQCGNKMMGVTRRQSWRRKDGRRANGTYRYYQCQSRNNQSVCSYHTWRESLLENQVYSQLKLAMLVSVSDESEEDRSRGEASRQERVVNAERRFMRAARRAARGEITITRLGSYLAELRKTRDARPAAEGPDGAAQEPPDWSALDVEERKALIDRYVGRIVVGDETVDITLA